jgi:serine/threonine protein kinase
VSQAPREPSAEEAAAKATLEALARTLPIASFDQGFGATIRPGTLDARVLAATQLQDSAPPERLLRAGELPATRGAPSASSAGATLPRLEVREPDADNTADLELVSRLGEGGMGVVWLARQRTLAREVAVKRLKHAGDTVAATSALLAEARATGAIEHPSVVPVHALGADESGAPLLVMKRIEGHSLEALVKDRAHPAWPALERRHGDRLGAIVEILARVADALELAHARGVIHRDVKPENVMIGSFGEVYLVDWGVALRLDALTAADRSCACIVGTPSFMAPEMASGMAPEMDARTDVYLLGATLHAAITARPRHEGQTITEVLLASLLSRPKSYPPELEELGALANRATSPNKSARPPSAAAFREALADFVRHRGSMRLVREAEERLAPLDGASAERLASADALRALTECRFALTQALREWRDNADARASLDRTLDKLIEAELHRRSPEVAAALLAERSKPAPDVASRIEVARAAVLESRRLEELARREERERDPRKTARQRASIAAALIVLTVVLVAMGWGSEQSHADGVRAMTEVLVYDAVFLGSAVALIALLHRRLFANRLGRQTSLVMVGLLALGTVSDGIFYLRDADPRDAGPFSMLTMASVLVGAGIGIDARFLASGGFFLTAGLVCALWPALTIPAIGAAAVGALLVILVDALLQLRSGEAPSPPPT